MKFNFKKITALGSTLLMAGMSIAAPIAAADYPAPFVTDGVANVAVVYSSNANANPTDGLEAGNLQTDLASNVESSGGTTTVEGESIILHSGSDRIYLKEQLGDGGKDQLTKDDLPTILADGSFDNGATNDYSQRIQLSTTTKPVFTFDDSGSDLDDPTLIMDLGTSTSTPVFDLIVDFDSATAFNTSGASGEKITIFGKTYTISSDTDQDDLVMFESSETISLSIGGSEPSSTTVTVDGETYTVELTGATVSTATVKVTDSSGNSDTKEVSEGASSKIEDIDIGVDIAASSEATSSESATLLIGANKIWLKEGNEVKVGASKDGIDGTYVDLTPNANNGALTQIKIRVTAKDNDYDHIAVGDSFADSVFGAVNLVFTDVVDGPEFDGEEDVSTSREKVEITADGNQALEITLDDNNGNAGTIPFAYDATTGDTATAILADSSGYDIFVLENETLEDEHYVILNSGGEYVAMGQVKTLTYTDCTSTDLTIDDVITGGTIVDWDDQAVDTTKTFVYGGKTFTVSCVDGSSIGISDSSSNIQVYPFIELINGYNHRVALTEPQTNVVGTQFSGHGDSVVLTLPTGDLTLTAANATGEECAVTLDAATGTDGNLTTNTTTVVSDSVQVGTVWYTVNVTGGAVADNCTDTMQVDIGIDSDQADTGSEYNLPGLLIVEDEDATNSQVKEAIFIKVDDATASNYYLETLAPIFTDGDSVSHSYEADGVTGYFDQFGAYALRNTDGDQDVIEVTLPKTQMYAELYVSESATTTSDGDSSGVMLVTDAEISSVQSKNLVIVGGSCINSAAATLLGGAYCGEAFTAQTQVGPGQFLLKGYDGGFTAGKIALLVAGYEAGDTANAAQYLRNIEGVDTSKTYIGTSSTTATLQTESA